MNVVFFGFSMLFSLFCLEYSDFGKMNLLILSWSGFRLWPGRVGQRCEACAQEWHGICHLLTGRSQWERKSRWHLWHPTARNTTLLASVREDVAEVLRMQSLFERWWDDERPSTNVHEVIVFVEDVTKRRVSRWQVWLDSHIPFRQGFCQCNSGWFGPTCSVSCPGCSQARHGHIQSDLVSKCFQCDGQEGSTGCDDGREGNGTCGKLSARWHSTTNGTIASGTTKENDTCRHRHNQWSARMKTSDMWRDAMRHIWSFLDYSTSNSVPYALDVVDVFLGQGICQTGYDGETCAQATEFHTTEQRSQIFAQHVSQKNSSGKLTDAEVPPCTTWLFFPFTFPLAARCKGHGKLMHRTFKFLRWSICDGFESSGTWIEWRDD